MITGFGLILTGLLMFSISWSIYENIASGKDFFLQVGNVGFWLFFIGLILIIWG